jgi:hypothetical protein
MPTKKIGGHSPPPSIQTPRSPTPSTSAPATSRPAPTAAPASAASTSSTAQKNDGFKSATGSATTKAPIAMPIKLPGGKDVSADFAKNPVGFASTNMLNVNNAAAPPGVPLPTKNATFVPASQSTVTVNANQNPGGNANLTFNPAGRPGMQAHYLHYLSGQKDAGRYAGISGVPLHPTANAPTTVVTGQLNGCAVHAFHDKNTQTMSFMHHADYSKNGPAELKEFMEKNPNLKHAATVGPKDYSFPTDAPKYKDGTTLDSGATLFAHYEKPTRPGQQGQWVMTTQLNEQKSNQYQEGRPDLVRPSFNGLPAPKPSPMMHYPIPLPTAE